MKRHPALVSLSREHHDGLLLAIRLQQGTKALERLWSHDLFWQADFVTAFFDDNLARHFRVEEEILFPAVQTTAKEAKGMIGILLAEHNEMREMTTFLRHPDEGKLAVTLVRFGEILERHIRREERELFPMCEEYMPAETLEALGPQLNR